MCRLGHVVGVKTHEARHEQEKPTAAGQEPTRRQGEHAGVSHGLHGGTRTVGAFFIEAPREGREPLGLEDLAHRRRAERAAPRLELFADFVDGVVRLESSSRC